MFLDKYLNSTYLDLVYSNYEEDYINLLDEDNFNRVSVLGDNFVEQIGKNMTLIDKIIGLAISYSEKDI